MAQDMTSFERAVDQVIVDSERLHLVVNGNAVDEVVVEDGTTIPTVRKAMLDSLYFKTPPIPWAYGASTTVFNQLYAFKGETGTQWWYAPAASKDNPVRMPADPSQSPSWRLYTDSAVMEKYYAKLNGPKFEGDPQAPTPPLDDKSKSIANTEFVVDYVGSLFEAIAGMKVTVGALVVKGISELANTIVGGTLTLHGPVNGADSTARFRDLILTANNSSLSFSWADKKHPDWRSTELEPHEVSTHRVVADTITSGKSVANNSDVHFEGLGNNFFDYVYVRGNSLKDSSEPTLVVDGTAKIKNLEILGTVTGVSFSIDGTKIYPSYIESSGDALINGDLEVGGSVVIRGTASVQDLSINTLRVNERAVFEGEGITANKGTVQSLTSDTVTAKTVNTDSCNVSKNLQVNGDVSLNAAGTGTTRIHNLEISGTVTGWLPDFSNVNFVCAGINSSGKITTTQGIEAGNTIISPSMHTGKVDFDLEEVTVSEATWTPSGNANMYVLHANRDFTIGQWPGTDGDDKPYPFTAVIYVIQDSTGHTVTLNDKYAILSATPVINNKASSVTLLQLTYCGVGDIVDVVIAQR
ncbi:polymer-forming cytoskeletal protein [Escherichia coli]|nr:polymer-forming cytoskeletal protein [Escherichia coli]